MAYADERRGYNRGHADGTRMIGAVECAATAQALNHKLVASRLVAQVNTVNAVNQDMQARLQAADEYIRFLDQGNMDLCAQILELGAEIEKLSAKLQEWEAYGRTSQATMAQLRQMIEDQRKKIDTQKSTIRRLTNDLAYEYGL